MAKAQAFESLQSEQILLYSENSSEVFSRVLLKIIKKIYKVIIV